RRRRCGSRSHGRDQEVDVVIRDEALIEAGRRRGIAAIVILDELDLASEETGARISLLAPQLKSTPVVLGRISKVSRSGYGYPNTNRLLSLCCGKHSCTGQRRYEGLQ